MIYLVTNNDKLQSDKYQIINVHDSLQLIKEYEVLQYDSETNGRDAHINELLSIQFGSKKGDFQIVIDCSTIDVLQYKEILETKTLIGQNIKFDLQFLYTLGITPNKVYDTMIVEQLLYLGFPPKGKFGGIGFGLNDISERYLGIFIDKSIRGDIIWRGLDEDVILYAAGDVQYLEDIVEKQWQQCKEKQCTIGAKLENKFVPVIAYLEWCGILLDVEAWKSKMIQDETNLKERTDLLNKFAIIQNNSHFYTINLQGNLFTGFDTEPKCNINWSSSSQVIKFAKYLGFDTNIVDKKTGETKDSVVEKHLKGQKGINDEFLKLYFEYQESAKVVSTYGQNYIDAINPITGRIHTNFKQLGASTSRMACGSNQHNKDLATLKKILSKQCKYVQLQTLPSDHNTRASFIAGKNRLFCSADYSGLEARLGADIYDEKSMIYEFVEGSGDIHSLVARACFEEVRNKSTEEIKKNYPHLRKKAKPVGFCFQFGGSAYAAKDSLGCTLEEAEQILQDYLKGFPGIAEFKKEGAKFVKENGYILLNPITGHKMYWWDWNEWKKREKEFKTKDWAAYKQRKQDNPYNSEVKEVSMHFKAASKYERNALNAPGQATGIIIMKHAMINFYKYILDNNLFNVVKINNIVHDEANIDYPNNMPEIADKLKECMENSAKIYCKKLDIPAEISVGDYWIH